MTMFEKERFIDECRAALTDDLPWLADSLFHDLVYRAMGIAFGECCATLVDKSLFFKHRHPSTSASTAVI